MLKVYDRTHLLRATIAPDDSSTRTCEVQGENVITTSFVHFQYIPFEVGDYLVWQGNTYTLLDMPKPEQISTVEWQYHLKFYGTESIIKRFLVLNDLDDYNPSFVLTDTAVEHLRIIVSSINNALGMSVWKVGEVATSTENLVLEYDGTYCHEALAKLAETCKTEWWIDGTTINLSRCSHGRVITLGYGQGLINLARSQQDGTKTFTRLYPVGSTRNIDPDTYGSPRLRMVGGSRYADSPLINTYGVIHHYETQAFAHIYPRRIGTVGVVQSEDRSPKEGDKFTVYYFSDTALTFNPNEYLLGGETLKMVFESGELQGQDFECNWDNTRKVFELITKHLDNGIQLPNTTLAPKSGDSYILYNLRMPDSYIAAAEQELSDAVQAYIAEQSVDTSVYKAQTDFEYLERNNIHLTLGQRVRLLSREYFTDGERDSRITRITQNLNIPTLAHIEISDTLARGTIARLDAGIADAKQRIKEVRNAIALPDLIRSWEDTPPANTNLYSAKAVQAKHLSRQHDDTAKGRIAFEQGITIGENYVTGLVGSGGNIDHLGNAELESLTLRRWLEVPELRYNRTTVHVGASFNSPAAGIVERVEKFTTSTGRVYLKLEDGELGTMEPGDLLMGIFHATQQNGGAIADTDNGRLDVTFSGFATVYFEVTTIDTQGRKWFDYRLREGTHLHPSPFMTFASRGNRHTPERQRFVFATRDYTRYLVNVNDWVTSPANIAVQVGDLTKVGDSAIPEQMTFGLYGNNVFLRQSLVVRGDGSTQTIDEALADTATVLQQRLNELRFSGRNLVPNSSYRDGKIPHFGKTNNGGATGLHAFVELRTVDGEPALFVQARGNPATQQGVWLGTDSLTQGFTQGETFVATFEIKGGGNFRDCSLEGQAVEGNLSGAAIPAEWTRVTWRGTFRQNGGAFIWYMQPQLYHNGQWRSWADTGQWGEWQALATAELSTLNDAQRSRLADFEARLPHFYIRRVKIAKGNLTDAYSEAPEDVDYLRRAFASTTEVAGGVVLSSVVGVRDAGGRVTAYLNGRTGEGGKALATGVANYGTQDEEAKSWIDFGGNAKFGNLRIGVEGDGTTVIEDKVGKERIRLSVDGVEPLTTVLNTLSDVQKSVPIERYATLQVGHNSSQASGEVVIASLQVLPQEAGGNLTVRVQGEYQLLASTYVPVTTNGEAHLYRNGELYHPVSQWSDIAENTYINKVVEKVHTFVYLPAGRYEVRIQVYGQTSSYGAITDYVRHRASASMDYHKAVDNNTLRLHRDGILLFLSQDKYFHLKGGDFTFKGNTDLPGVLLAGVGGRNGGMTKVWGMKKHATKPIVRNSVGYYTIWHSIGHEEYTVNVLSQTPRLTPYVSTRYADRVDVYFHNSSGSLTDTAFDFQLFGQN